MKSLNEIQAVVTGGATGVGRATVEALLAQGAKVRVVSRSADKLEKLKGEVKGTIEVVQGDIAEKSVVEKTASRVQSLRMFSAKSERISAPCTIG